jgi:hypothetical protein
VKKLVRTISNSLLAALFAFVGTCFISVNRDPVHAAAAAPIETILIANDGEAGDSFGSAVSIYGDTAVIGAPEKMVNGQWAGGAVYVFTRSGSVWSQQAELVNPDAGGFWCFRYGKSVSIYGDTLVVGAETIYYGSGNAYIYTRHDGVWSQEASYHGSAVSVYGNTVALGDHVHFGGVCSVLTRSDSNWILQDSVNSSDGDYFNCFGSAVDLFVDTLAVGDIGYFKNGAVFVFTRSGTAWSEQQKIEADDPAIDDRFGNALDISGDTLVVGSVGNSDNSGAAYVFTPLSGVLTEQQKLTADDAGTNDEFGNSVTIDTNTIVAGAQGNSIGTGAAYVFLNSGGVWSQNMKLTASDGAIGDRFGAVAINSNTVVAGAPGANAGTGKAYIYVLPTYPSVGTAEVTSVTIHSAQLNGSVTSMGTATSVTTHFVWGTAQNNLINTLDCQTLTANGSFSGNITGLSPATTYYYQAQAVGQGTGQGTIKTFTTLSTPPSVTTANVTNVGHFGARLNGNVSALGSAPSVNVSFQWGTKAGNYSGETAVQAIGAAGSFYADLSGLSANTNYYYRAKAVGHGTVYGSEKSLKTLTGGQIPAAVTDNATNVGYNSARINCTVTSIGTVQSAAVYFAWGTAPGVYTGTSQTVTVNGVGPVSLDVAGFSASTVYYYRAYVSFLFGPGDGGGFLADNERTFTTSEAPPPPPPSYGGGGFGGGGGGGVPPGAGVTNLGIYTNSEGLFNIAGAVESEDGNVIIAIAKGVMAQTKDNTALKSLKIVAIDSPGTASAGSQFIGLIYELTPDGATFTPGITLTVFFDPAAVPAGIDLNSLKIAVYNPATSAWELLPSILNKTDSSISVTIEHFSIYSIVGSKIVPPTTPKLIPLPAKFATAELTVSPVSALAGQTVEVSTMVNNSGETTGEYEVILKVNGTVEETRKVTVGAKGSAAVTFNIIKSEPGSYDVNVNGATGSFSIQQSPSVTTTPSIPVEQPATKTTVTNWAVIGLIIGGVVLIGLVGLVFLRRRKTA